MIKVFKSSLKIYEYSKNKELFYKILHKNNIFLSNEILLSLTSLKLKERARKLYKFFSDNNILTVPINSTKYPKQFYNMDIPPICIFIYGNINALNNDIICLYNGKFSKYGKKVYSDFSKYIISKNINIIGDGNDDEYISICIEGFKTFDEIILKEYINNLSLDKVNIFFSNEFYKMYKYYLISTLAKFIVVIEGGYGDIDKLKLIVDFSIEQDKEILVTPGNIYNKYAYFSNYLIKQGANIILNKYDIDSYL